MVSLPADYHGWSYGFNGKLAKAPRFDEVPGFQKENHGLFPIHVHIDECGFVWVNLDASPTPSVAWDDDFHGVDTQERFRNFDFSQYKFDHTWEMQGDYNWKTLADNYNECYHCAVAHPDVAKLADLSYYYIEGKGGHIQHFSRPKAGKEDIDIRNASTYYFPNSCMTVSPHFFYLMRCVPTSVGTCSMEYEVYRQKDASDEDFTYIDSFFKRVLTEDKTLCNNTQKNLEAGIFVNGHLHPELEKGPLYFQKVVRELVTSHRAKEVDEGREIWPASRHSSGGGSTDEDIAFCSGLACDSGKAAELAWRKKTRCPGERPACSTCTRLHQVCYYSDRNVQFERLLPTSGGSDLEGRLAQLEEKMDLVLERTMPEPPSQSVTPESYTRASSSHQATPNASARPPPITVTPSHSSTLPPKDVVLEAVQLYFQYCHRQPLWLFERSDLNHLESCPEEIIFSLLALAVRYSNAPFFECRSQDFSQKYSEIARGHIMLRIAQGTVQLSTIQSLCLLAFANFVARDTHLAWLHISLANSLSHFADMDVELNDGDYSSVAEAKRRVFYSIHLLNNLYGPRSMTLNILEGIDKPHYVGSKQDTSWETSKPPPLMPQEFLNDTETSRGGIWIYMVQQSSLWAEVRNYIAHCADGDPKPPWAPDSRNTMIGAHLMDLETRFPTYYRYDAARFLDRSNEELQRNREFWSPWLYLQFSYHAVHSVLNHPFLLSSRPFNSVPMTVPNTFWKTSSEMAFLHSSWTARLIDMVTEKDYQISDPFIGYNVAVAATIHLYYCRAADSRVRNSAETKLAKCMKFVEGLGMVWPVCRLMHEKLAELVQSAFNSNKQSGDQEGNFRTVSINIALMWDILDYASLGRRPQKSGRGIFDPTFVQEKDEEEEDEHTVETQIFHRPMAEVDTSNGGQELPPYSDLAVRRRNPRRRQGGNGHVVPAEDGPSSQQQNQQSEIANWPEPPILGNTSIMDATHDSLFQLLDHGSPYFLGFWDSGNL
ncbi:hypothetical protein B7463_g9796, partial [Scytalidium lignicola]